MSIVDAGKSAEVCADSKNVVAMTGRRTRAMNVGGVAAN